MSSDPFFPGFLFVACVMLVILVHSLRQRATLNKHGIRVLGEIVELQINGLDLLHRYPVIRFQTRAGQWVTVSSSERVDMGEYSKGQKVEIIYLPADPEQFRIVSELEVLLRPTPPRVPSRLAKGQERRAATRARKRNGRT